MFPCSFIISMAFRPFVLDNSKKVMVLTDRFINDTTKRLVLFIQLCSIYFFFLMWRRNSGLHHLLIFGSPSQCSTMFRRRLVKVIKRYFYLLSIQATVVVWPLNWIFSIHIVFVLFDLNDHSNSIYVVVVQNLHFVTKSYQRFIKQLLI